MADKRTVTMIHPKARMSIEALPDSVPDMKKRGWQVKGDKAASVPQKEVK